MLSMQKLQPFRTAAVVLIVGGAVAAASLIWFRYDPGARIALPTGKAVDPQQIMRDKKDLPAQPLADFSVIFPEASAPAAP